jgi:outer membrane lipoprotein SlyB
LPVLIESSNKTKDTALRTGGGGALGAVIGAVAGGGKGAAIGAILGAGVGAGSVYIQGNKDLVLDPGAEMTVRVAAPRRQSARQ